MNPTGSEGHYQHQEALAGLTSRAKHQNKIQNTRLELIFKALPQLFKQHEKNSYFSTYTCISSSITFPSSFPLNSQIFFSGCLFVCFLIPRTHETSRADKNISAEEGSRAGGQRIRETNQQTRSEIIIKNML